MTSLVPELAGLPDGLAVDGELIAFGDDGLPSFPRLCDRMLHGKHHAKSCSSSSTCSASTGDR